MPLAYADPHLPALTAQLKHLSMWLCGCVLPYVHKFQLSSQAESRMKSTYYLSPKLQSQILKYLLDMDIS